MINALKDSYNYKWIRKTHITALFIPKNVRVLPKDTAYGSPPCARRQVLNSAKAKNNGE